MSTFGDMDPSAVVPGMLTVKHGVPSREGERGTRIIDGGSGFTFPHSEVKLCEGFGETISPRCEIRAERKSDLVGLRDESFIVTVRFHTGATRSYHSGYRWMHKARWKACVTECCMHDPNNSVELPIESCTLCWGR